MEKHKLHKPTVDEEIVHLSQCLNSKFGNPDEVREGMPEIIRSASADGIVMLENNGVLPFKKDETINVFGRTQYDYFVTGYGSGGDVNKPYIVNIVDGINNCKKLNLNKHLAEIYKVWSKDHLVDVRLWGKWPLSLDEMPIDKKTVEDAKKISDKAVVVIGRCSGEDRDNALEKGSYFLKDDEIALLNEVTSVFDNIVVIINTACIMDMAWINDYKDKIGAVLLAWQGGMESGNAIADILCGDVTPSGRLSSTIAKDYEFYPSSQNFGNSDFNNYQEDVYVGYRYFETFKKDEVLYPFAYGLSYCDFDIKYNKIDIKDDKYIIDATVTNLSDRFSGKETLCVYIEKPCGVLGNPSRELVAFKKSKLLDKKESQNISLSFDKISLASYDDCGKTGNKSSYVIQKGTYKIYLGTDVRSAKEVYSFEVENNKVVKKLSQIAGPREAFDIMVASEDSSGNRVIKYEPVEVSKTDLKEIITKNMPKEISQTGDKGIKLQDVKNGKNTMDEFIAQLSLEELEALSRGDKIMNSPLGAKGNAGAFGGILQSLRDKGVPPVITTDGPSGVRLAATCSLIPIGTLLACTFDTELVESIYKALGEEAKDLGSCVLLAPGINIHRNPLCGRNFEYYSEDPFLAGMMASASVKGIQGGGVSACPKHFACNNQEYRRYFNDSRVSERALREIYLKPFELCIQNAKPQNIMTCYNKINGVWGHYHYELCTLMLRDEWGYEGNVMTDWWMQPCVSPEFDVVEDNDYRVRAQVNVLMPGESRADKAPIKDLLVSYGTDGGITLGELQKNAKSVLAYAMNSTKFED